MSPKKIKYAPKHTAATRQESMQARVDTARREEKRKPSRAPAYIDYKNVDPRIETALYYGFTPPAAPISITKEDREKADELGDKASPKSASLAPALEEKIALLRYYADKHLFECAQPIMYCAEFASGNTLQKKAGEHHLSYEIMGSSKSVGEATLIQVAFATLKDAAHGELTLSLNSVGDRESQNRFLRELGNYYRRHVPSLPVSCKTQLRENPRALLSCEHEKCKALAEEAPKSIGFLSDESRRHFKEVLEFLEELEIPYRIGHRLLGDHSFSSETVFEIQETLPDGTTRVLCAGGRYNNLGKRLGLKREVPSVGMNLLLPKTGEEVVAARTIRFKRPTIFFLQLGFCAKLKSLRVIEILRQARIPLYQALNRDKLISQISSAENLRIPYSLIFGQREALENSVIVRNTASRAQETVPLCKLAEYFKKMKLG